MAMISFLMSETSIQYSEIKDAPLHEIITINKNVEKMMRARLEGEPGNGEPTKRTR